MKRLILVRASWVIGIALLVVMGCGGNKVTDTDLALTAKKMVNNLAGELKSELYTAIQDSGVVWAVRICSEKAPEVFARHSSIPGWTIKRVSEKYRNPANAPDDFEMDALKTLAGRPANAGDEYYQWTEEDGQKSFRFVKAIKLKQTCRNCHGNKDDFSDELKTILDEKYPDDMGHGYSIDDIRGIFSVKVDWPEGKAALDSLMTAM